MHTASDQAEPWGSITWLVEAASHPGADLSLARMTVEPGATSSAHRHANASEAIHVVAGRIEERVGAVWAPAGPGDTVFVPAGEVHQTRCVGDAPAVMIIAYSSGARAYEQVDA